MTITGTMKTTARGRKTMSDLPIVACLTFEAGRKQVEYVSERAIRLAQRIKALGYPKILMRLLDDLVSNDPATVERALQFMREKGGYANEAV